MLHKPRTLARLGLVYCSCGCSGQQRSRTIRSREKAAWKKEVRRG